MLSEEPNALHLRKFQTRDQNDRNLILNLCRLNQSLFEADTPEKEIIHQRFIASMDGVMKQFNIHEKHGASNFLEEFFQRLLDSLPES